MPNFEATRTILGTKSIRKYVFMFGEQGTSYFISSVQRDRHSPRHQEWNEGLNSSISA